MKDIVPFELAKKLKEKGYPQRTFGDYDMIGSTYFEDGRYYKDGCICNKNDAYTAPQIHQVLKWLREEKKIYIVTDPFPSYSNVNNVTWVYKLKYNNDGDSINFKESLFSFGSYEEATTAGIEYALNNLIRPCSTNKE